VQRQQHASKQMQELLAKQSKMEQLLTRNLIEYPRMQTQLRGAQGDESQTDEDPPAVQEQIYAELGRKYRVDQNSARKPPCFGTIETAPNTSPYERATANFLPRTTPKLNVWPCKPQKRLRNSRRRIRYLSSEL
jgi:hypothetical protein